MLFKIFNGTSRGLGEDGRGRDIYAQIGVEFRDYLKHFKGAKFSVFMCLLLHSDESGWSFPSIELIAGETGYTISEIKETITELCNLLIEGRRVLFAMQVKEHGRFKRNKYLVFPTAAEIEQYAAYERRPRKKAGKQGTPPRPGFPSTGKPSTENWPLSRTSLKQNHSKETHPASASLVAVAASDATTAISDATDKVKKSLPDSELQKEVHALLRDFYGITYKASRDKIIANLSPRPDLILQVIRKYGDEIQENHRRDDHYNCAGALVRVLCDLDMRIFVSEPSSAAHDTAG